MEELMTRGTSSHDTLLGPRDRGGFSDMHLLHGVWIELALLDVKRKAEKDT